LSHSFNLNLVTSSMVLFFSSMVLFLVWKFCVAHICAITTIIAFDCTGPPKDPPKSNLSGMLE